MKIWKRNAIVVIIVMFVGVAVYLNWSYGQTTSINEEDAAATGKLLGEAALVSNQTKNEAATDTLKEETTQADANQKISTGYFASARLNRQQARDSALQILQEAAADAMANQSIIDEANASIQTLADFTLAEAQVENLVIAKGYSDCVCYINENSASVVVSATETGLNESDTARIAEIVMDETGLTAGQIKIIETAS
jgi:stage III sporulation protein AH